MRRFVTLICFMCVLSLAANAQVFERMAIIEAAVVDTGGFGNVVAGLDLDGDGLQEIYAVNSDWLDIVGLDLVPRIYKYESDGAGGWTTVWSTRLPLEFQNTWPPLAYGDLDNDGKGEIIWGPINNFGGGLQPNPERIVVFEAPGDGSDNMGIDNGDGTWRPNASWTITSQDNNNLRPFRWHVADIDSDGTDEIVAFCRVGNGIQIYSVDDIPDFGFGTEVWTEEYSGQTGTFYDGFVIGNTAYGIRDNGDVHAVRWNGSTYESLPVQLNLVVGGSWNSATVVDINNDGTMEALVAASWLTATTTDVWLLQQSGDSLTATSIKDIPDNATRPFGGTAGDFDGNGNLDFAFGTRQSTPNALIYNLAYLGGDITSEANWKLAAIDSGIATAVQYDIFASADVDGNGTVEIMYTGTPRSAGADGPQPIVILNNTVPVGIEEIDTAVPSGFVLEQNYPNPFNPETTIRFALPQAAEFSLNIYNIRGQLVKSLAEEFRPAGTYEVKWNGTDSFGSRVASGTYIYQLRAGSVVETKKMVLIK